MADALRGEHAAIYAYGILGPHLTGAALALARQAETDHRNQRDALLETLTDPPGAQALYAIPFPVTDPASAVRLAVYVEEHCAVLWRAATVVSAGEGRRSPLTALTDAANRAAAFRRAGGAVPGTVAFPGLTA
ncbi:MAG TPA: ferritin-like domain-containing protein [Micromonosporaceae bacterium]|nr:ferritin-like domain-containing protein [Micromonosporaceae bacterium]